MEERDRQQREETERMLKARSILPQRQFENFLSGKYSRATCLVSYYPNPTSTSIKPLMKELRRLVNIIGVDEAKRLLGYHDTTATATTTTATATAAAATSTN
jgi:hypothetical protein